MKKVLIIRISEIIINEKVYKIMKIKANII